MSDTTIDEDDILQFDEEDGPIIGYNFPPNIKHIDFYNYRHSLVGVEFPPLQSIYIEFYNLSLHGVNFQNVKKLLLNDCLDIPELNLFSIIIKNVKLNNIILSNINEVKLIKCNIGELFANNIDKLTIDKCCISHVQIDVNYLKYIKDKISRPIFSIKCHTIEVDNFNDFDSMYLSNDMIIKTGQKIDDNRFCLIGPNTYRYNNFGMVFID